MSLPRETISANPPAKPDARYRALDPLAVASIIVGAFSILTGLSVFLVVIPLAGIFLGWRAQRRILRSPEEWTGLRAAHFGMGLSLGLWILGFGWLFFAGAREIPYGYQLITYEMLQPDPMKPTELVPQSTLDMQDRKVFIKGYMQPRRQQTGIKEFILCPASGDCPFCIPNPRPTEMIRIVLQGDLQTAFTTHLVGVAGRFRVDLDDPSGIPYAIEADLLR